MAVHAVLYVKVNASILSTLELLEHIPRVMQQALCMHSKAGKIKTNMKMNVKIYIKMIKMKSNVLF